MAPWLGRGAIFVSGRLKRWVAGAEDGGVCSQGRQTGRARMHRRPQSRPMRTSRILAVVCCGVLASGSGATGYSHTLNSPPSGQEQPPTAKQGDDKDAQAGVPALPRGKKLVLKDGSFQLVRDYRRNGERVRYLSAERGDWEEIPAAAGGLG